MSTNAPDPCFATATPMYSVEEAVAAMLADAVPVTRSRTKQLADAGGRILAEAVSSPLDVPGFDNSAMDGYTFNTRDLEQARTQGLRLSGRIQAGSTGAALTPGDCARIFTGAPTPQGANAVAMQEICRIEGDRVFITDGVAAGANIRPRGNDIACGDTILAAGTRLRAAHIGLAAAVGIDRLRIFRKLRVAIFSTGNELVEPGRNLEPGQIYNSNRYLLHNLLTVQGCKVIDLGTIADDFNVTRETLSQAATAADLIITSGGVSVGEEDHIKAALESIGKLNLWRVRMKPGKPLVYGRVRRTPFIGLPGNPVSVFVTFLLFALPYLHRLQGRTPHQAPVCTLRADFSYRARNRREYVRVQVRDSGAGPVALAFPRQGSDVLSSVSWADGLVEIAENTAVQPGDNVRYLSFAEWLQ
jgi:molybdopterin molybdotransferase